VGAALIDGGVVGIKLTVGALDGIELGLILGNTDGPSLGADDGAAAAGEAVVGTTTGDGVGSEQPHQTCSASHFIGPHPPG